MKATAVAAGTAAALALAGPAAAYYALTSTPAEARHPVATLGAPTAPTAAARVVDHVGVVDLTWSAPVEPAGATGLAYTVARDGTVVCTTTATSCSDGGLAPGSTVAYELRAHLGTWTSPPTTVQATVPDDPGLTAAAPSSVLSGTPFTVTLTATNGLAPDLSAVGTRRFDVSGASTTVGPVDVAFTAQPDGSVSGTATVTLTALETVALTFTDIALPARTATTGPVTVSRAGGGLTFADCQGPAGYSCGSPMPLDGATMSALLTRAAFDAAGNPLPLPAATVTVALRNDRKGSLDTQTVAFAEGATSSGRFSFIPDPGDNGRVQITATALPDQPAPAPLQVVL